MKEQHTLSTTSRFARVITATLAALVLGAGIFLATPAQPASANPCNYQKQVYCDGGDEPAWQWDGVDDFECVGIPGFAWNGDTADYSGVVGQVYYLKNGAYSLIHDSTPPPPPPPAAPAPAPATGSKASGSAAAATPEPTPTETADPEPSATPDAVDPATVTGDITVQGGLIPGGVITLHGTGFAPDTQFVIEVHSEARTLTTVDSDASGTFAGKATIPSDLAPGVHTVVVLVDGTEVTRTRITVSAPAGTGSDTAALWLLGALGGAAVAALAVYAVLKSRRRRVGSGAASEPVAAATS
jgi:hypothetical protein